MFVTLFRVLIKEGYFGNLKADGWCLLGEWLGFKSKRQEDYGSCVEFLLSRSWMRDNPTKRESVC